MDECNKKQSDEYENLTNILIKESKYRKTIKNELKEFEVNINNKKEKKLEIIEKRSKDIEEKILILEKLLDDSDCDQIKTILKKL